MTEMFGEAWPPMSVPDLAPDDDDDDISIFTPNKILQSKCNCNTHIFVKTISAKDKSLSSLKTISKLES